MTSPLLLDLFAGAGGAGAGYARAGFRVVGCDLDPKPLRHNPHECYQGDALETLDTLLSHGAWQGYRLHDFDAIHASPPCQGYSIANNIHGREHPKLIDAVVARLTAWGGPWVIENVRGALRDMPASIQLCGTYFGLKVYRHRLFACSHLLFAPAPCSHPSWLLPGYVSVYGGTCRSRQTGNKGNAYKRYPLAYTREAMGIDWMGRDELSQAIPPAYTEWIGRQLIAILASRAA